MGRWHLSQWQHPLLSNNAFCRESKDNMRQKPQEERPSGTYSYSKIKLHDPLFSLSHKETTFKALFTSSSLPAYTCIT